MNVYWMINLVVWTIVLVVSAIGALAAAARRPGKVRYGDPMRLATFLVASLFIGHTLRWLVWPDSLNLWKALYIVGALTGLHVIRLMFAYGRGARV